MLKFPCQQNGEEMIGKKIVKGILKVTTGILLLNAIGNFSLAIVGPIWHYAERAHIMGEYRKTDYYKEMRAKDLSELNKDYKEKYEALDPSNPDDVFKLERLQKEYEYYKDLIVYDSHNNHLYSIMNQDEIHPEYFQNYDKAGTKMLQDLLGFVIGGMSLGACIGTNVLDDNIDIYDPEEETKKTSTKNASTKERSK